MAAPTNARITQLWREVKVVKIAEGFTRENSQGNESPREIAKIVVGYMEGVCKKCAWPMAMSCQDIAFVEVEVMCGRPCCIPCGLDTDDRVRCHRDDCFGDGSWLDFQ